MGSALPDWLTPVAWIYIAASLLSVALIAADIYLLGRCHRSTTTELVWVTSALYLGPFAIPAYLRLGRTSTHHAALHPTTASSTATSAAVAVLPGGGASAVAHLIAVPFVVAVGWTIAGMSMWPMILAIAVLAIAMLAVYERAASRAGRAPAQRGLTVGAAVLAAVVTVVAFDIGMVGWMLVLHFNNMMPAVTEGTFWFLMQVGVIVGLVTGYPAVKWLMSRNQSVVPA
ncbi:DUF4396 domain-containing protein [Nocardioides aurantiacus]|nr:DUF4396 domain-containing protein [Nocardioides aurantiacus]